MTKLTLIQEQLQALYKYNTRPEFLKPQYYDKNNLIPGEAKIGPGGRKLLNLAYAIAFTCLLRVDEVLRIEHRHIIVINDEAIEINLDYRKTARFGGKRWTGMRFEICSSCLLEILPFVLRKMPPELTHLCAFRAYADWIHTTQIVDGYVFRKIDKFDRVIDGNEPMVSVWH